MAIACVFGPLCVSTHRLSLFVIFVFRPLFFEDSIFLCFMYAIIMAGTVLLVHLKMLSVSVTESLAKRMPAITFL